MKPISRDIIRKMWNIVINARDTKALAHASGTKRWDRMTISHAAEALAIAANTRSQATGMLLRDRKTISRAIVLPERDIFNIS